MGRVESASFLRTIPVSATRAMPSWFPHRYDAKMFVGSQRRSFQIDAVMAVAMFALALMSLVGTPVLPDVRPLDVLGYILIAAQTLTLAWRRRYPVIVTIVVVGAFVIERGFAYPSSWAVFGIAFALYTIGEQLPTRQALIVGGVAIGIIVVWTAVGVLSYGLPAAFVVTVFGFVTFPFALGLEARRRERRALGLEARAVRAEIEREQRTAEAIRQEKLRIGRELHDVVAHEVTVMTIQAAAAGRVLDSRPEEARQAIETVESAGHRALAEMRRLLGVLRTEPDRDLSPQPGLSSLGDLISQMMEAGLDVDLQHEGEEREVPSSIGLNAYRIIQESLTNAVKHAGPGARAEVEIRFSDEQLRIEVCDDGRGAAEALRDNGSGQGIMGMRERVALLGGTFSAGPMAGGGYRVVATIPLGAS